MIKLSGMDYLRIDVANYIDDGDKKQFEDRIQWTKDNDHQLEALLDKADDFYRYAAAVHAYRQSQRGIATGHSVGLDACASGPQILSCLLGDWDGARNTGAIGDRRMDVYGECTKVMNAMKALDREYSRKEVKSAFMPFFYGSMALPIKVFGEGTEELNSFFRATEITCPGAYAYLKTVATMWDEYALYYIWDLPDGFTSRTMVTDHVEDVIEVDTIEGHPTFTYRREININTEKGRCLQANGVHSVDAYIVRELCARCNHDKGKLRTVYNLIVHRLKQGGVSYREGYLRCEELWRKHECLSIVGVEYVNEYSVYQMSDDYCRALLSLVRETLKRPSFQVIAIHDEFKALAPYLNWVRQTYIDLLAELAESRVLDAILSDIAGRPIRIKKLSDNLAAEIRKAEYPLA